MYKLSEFQWFEFRFLPLIQEILCRKKVADAFNLSDLKVYLLHNTTLPKNAGFYMKKSQWFSKEEFLEKRRIFYEEDPAVFQKKNFSKKFELQIVCNLKLCYHLQSAV